MIRVASAPRSYLVPLVIAAAFLLILLTLLLFNKRLSVAIQVGDAPGKQTAAGTAPGNAARFHPVSLEAVELSTLDFRLSPNLAPRSLQGPETLLLIAPAAAGQAYAAYAFSSPFNAADYVLEFEARGRHGKESVEVIFTDAEQRPSANLKPFIPFPVGLSSDWRKAQIVLDRSEAFDAQRVSQLRFEVGPARTGNASGSAVYIRNIRWKPRA